MEKEKNQNLQMILLSIVIVLFIGALVYLLFFNKKDELKPQDIKKTEEKINTPTDNTNQSSEEETETVSLDYAKIEADLIKKVNNEKKHIYLETCESCEGIYEDNANEAVCNKKELNVNSITTFINKLQKANKVEELPTSKSCSLYTYSIEGNDLLAFEADDPSILLVGLNGNGYAFHFSNEDIRAFLKTLA